MLRRLRGSEAWEAEHDARQKAANDKRSAAMEGNRNAVRENNHVSHDTRLFQDEPEHARTEHAA